MCPPAGKIGGAGRNRTGDLRLAKPALSQLSYSPPVVGKPDAVPPVVRTVHRKKNGGPKWI